jgi:hypothetical protein
MALLGRIADGESAFFPENRRSVEAGAQFDQLVRDLLRLQSDGLVEGVTAWAEVQIPGREYAWVTNVAITPAGLASASRAVPGRAVVRPRDYAADDELRA